MTSEKSPPPKPVPLDNDIMKGTMVDGFGLSIGSDYIIIDGYILPPRSEKSVVVTRMLLPTRALPHVIEGLNRALKESQKAEIKVESTI